MDHEKMRKALIGLENHRIRFVTSEGPYEGTVVSIAVGAEYTRLAVHKLTYLPNNTKFRALTFRSEEIKSLEILERLKSAEEPKSAAVPYINDQSKYARDRDIYTLLDDEDFDDAQSITESELHDEMHRHDDDVYVLKLPPYTSDYLPLDHAIIDELNDDYHASIRLIQKEDVIGMSLESPKISRNELLHWLCISTAACTYLFDVHRLGSECFANGLRDILEEPRIEKVIHDCRRISDCLYHQFNCKLVNVFDTQVADYIISHQRRVNRKPTKFNTRVSDLNTLLSCYLDIPDEFLYCRKQGSYHDDLVFYSLRPISDNFRDLFIKNVIYLRRLKQELDILLVEPLSRCVDIYLKVLKNKTDQEFALESLDSGLVPEDFLSEKIQVFGFQNYLNVPDIVSSGPPYRKITNLIQNYVDYCEDNNIGVTEESYVEAKCKAKCFPSKPFNPAEFICRKEVCETSCVKFVNGHMFTCRPREDASPTSKSLRPPKSEVQSTSDQTSSTLSDSDDCWTELRTAYENVCSTNDVPKSQFIAG